jgi:hypothetical protein
MNEDLQRYLDGEMPLESLGADAGEEAAAWERLLNAFRSEMDTVSPPPWLELKVMADIEALPAPGPVRRFVEWLTLPRPIRVSPLLAGLTAAAVALVLLVGRPSGPVPEVQDDLVVYVQFALEAPGAQSVAVAGDFDGWEGSHLLEDVDGDGVWTGRIPLQPGVHAYMFLVDGSDWITDPRAQRYQEDGFGNRNAVLAVAAPSA